MTASDKQREFISTQVAIQTQIWVSRSALIGAVFFPMLSLLDYYVTPTNFKLFLMYRFIIAAVLLCSSALSRFSKNIRWQYAIIFVAVSLSALTIELMVLNFGGHQSPYYAGMNLLIIAVLLIPVTFRFVMVIGATIYLTYLLPILLFDTITDPAYFIMNNAFLVSVLMIGMAWRFLSQQSLEKELSLQYEIEQKKEALEQYSTQLEVLVEERTRELNKSESMLRSLYENANEGIVIMDSKGIIKRVNKKACEIHGFDRDSLNGANIELLEPEENKRAYRERMEKVLNGEALTFVTQHYRKDGTRVAIDISCKAIEVDGKVLIQSFYRDITEKKRLQEQLFQSQKMESIGLLVGGIAHDFNNMLGAILGHAELLNEYGTLDDSSRKRVHVIESSARRATQMISRLLGFVRQKKIEFQVLSLNAIIKDTLDLLERIIAKKNIIVKTEFDFSIPPIQGDGNQLEQVVMNLLVNAKDAMKEGGTITIQTTAAEFQDDPSLIHPLLGLGRYVILRISDTGSGIPDEIKGRIFDPFFTTKETGKGTGLGLSMVYNIVQDHKGIINLISKDGKGTTFEIYLPASTQQVELRPDSLAGVLSEGRETILVVDDEEHMLSFMRGTLEGKGYKIISTDNPVNALDIFRKSSDHIDLVVTDIVMPLVNGTELIKSLKEAKQTVKVIAVSGYDFDHRAASNEDVDIFLTKPFQGSELLSSVRKLLDQRLRLS